MHCRNKRVIGLNAAMQICMATSYYYRRNEYDVKDSLFALYHKDKLLGVYLPKLKAVGIIATPDN